MKTGAQLIYEERKRQIEVEKFTSKHDAGHTEGELADAARCYIANADRAVEHLPVPVLWPWEIKWWKPTGNRVRDLTKAGALIAAEIDRLQRAK